jgi:hypothetical protein
MSVTQAPPPSSTAVVTPVTTETKPGYLTTEFWTTISLSMLGVVQMATGAVDVNNKYVALGMAIVAGLYNGSRGLAKAGVPYNK